MGNRDDRHYDERMFKKLSAVKKIGMVNFQLKKRWYIPKDWNGVFGQYSEFLPEHINSRSVFSISFVVAIFFDS